MKKDLSFIKGESLLAKTLEALPAKDLKKYLLKNKETKQLIYPHTWEMGALKNQSQFFTRLEWLSAVGPFSFTRAN